MKCKLLSSILLFVCMIGGSFAQGSVDGVECKIETIPIKQRQRADKAIDEINEQYKGLGVNGLPDEYREILNHKKVFYYTEFVNTDQKYGATVEYSIELKNKLKKTVTTKTGRKFISSGQTVQIDKFKIASYEVPLVTITKVTRSGRSK